MRWVLVPGVRAAWGLCADRLRDSEGIGDAWDLLLAHDSLAIWVEDIENDRAVGDTVEQHGSRHQTDHNQSRVLGGRSEEEERGRGGRVTLSPLLVSAFGLHSLSGFERSAYLRAREGDEGGGVREAHSPAHEDRVREHDARCQESFVDNIQTRHNSGEYAEDDRH